MFVSIVIPTYNEAADIGTTLDSLVALEYDDYEVLVVDASQDATPQIVANYPSPKVRLVPQTRGKGRVPARNQGVLEARGEILILLNADVRLPKDFIRRILPHYERGADYVLVESRVTNVEFAPARFVQALHAFHYPARPEVEAQMNWTEGFSCRRSAAMAIGLAPEGEAVPLMSGEDGWFGEKLAAAGYHKVFDRSIEVTHVMPPDLAGFWAKRKERGHGVPQILYMRDHWPMPKVTAYIAWLSFLTGLALLIPLPSVWRGWQLAGYSPRGRADWITFSVLDWIRSAGNVWGLIYGTAELWRAGAR